MSTATFSLRKSKVSKQIRYSSKATRQRLVGREAFAQPKEPATSALRAESLAVVWTALSALEPEGREWAVKALMAAPPKPCLSTLDNVLFAVTHPAVCLVFALLALLAALTLGYFGRTLTALPFLFGAIGFTVAAIGSKSLRQRVLGHGHE